MVKLTPKFRLFFLVSLFATASDLVSKSIVFDIIEKPEGEVLVIGEFFKLVRHTNRGGPFSVGFFLLFSFFCIGLRGLPAAATQSEQHRNTHNP